MSDDINKLKIDVELLKKDVSNITVLCQKMDAVIEKLLQQQEKYIKQIYEDMDDRRVETNNDIKELHSRITNVSRDLSDKMELSERRIMEEIKTLRKDIANHNAKEDESLDKLTNWKWMMMGALVGLGWLLSHVNFATLVSIMK